MKKYFGFAKRGVSIGAALLIVSGCQTAPERPTASGRRAPPTRPGATSPLTAPPPAPVVQTPTVNSPAPSPVVESTSTPAQPNGPSVLSANSSVAANSAVMTAPSVTANTSPVAGRRVAVILGAGGTRTFAHIGVLREFERRHIPIEAVVGLEWGALPAALYAQEGRVNDVEWQMFKLKPEMLPRTGLLKSTMEPESPEALSEYFKQSFSDKRANDSRVHFMCPYTSHDGERVGWGASGKFRDLVALCLPYAPLFETRATRAAPFAAADSIQALRRQGFTDIVFVNILGSGPVLAPQKFAEARTTELLWTEIRSASRTALLQVNWPVDVPVRGAGLTGLEKAREDMTLGQKAASSVAEHMAQSLGLLNAN